MIFERLMYAMIALGACLAILDAARIAALTGAGAGFVLAGSLLGLAIFGLLVWLAARRRKNWARWTLLIVAVVGFFMAYPQLSKAFQANTLLGSLHLVQYLMELVALWFVFSGDAKAWFRKPAAAESAV
jgi:hypothetical protein